MTTQAADGAIVPFTSVLPLCASLCGPLFDVQGKCSPPNIAAVDDNCFCTDSRLTAFNNDGTAGVSSVCGTTVAGSCTSTTDLQTIKTWYDNFCATVVTTTTSSTTGAATSTSTSGASSGSSSKSSSAGQTWLSGHWKWVVMLVILFVLIVGGWVLACVFRRRYLRRKEKEFEMRPPVAWGPHQMQSSTGGFGGGVSNPRLSNVGGHHKEAAAAVAPVKGNRLSKSWFGSKK